jgi:hypothetical protein
LEILSRMKSHLELCQKGKLMTKGAQYLLGVPVIVLLLQEEVMDTYGFGMLREVKSHSSTKFLYAKQSAVLLLTLMVICWRVQGQT